MDRVIKDRYKLIEVIGEGGMNTVFKAEDLDLGELVAVKILRPEYRKDEDIIKKFHTEAEAIQKIHNDNIVKVMDVGSEGDVHFIVMELLTQDTLKDYISQSDVYFKNEEIIDISLQILNAIKAAHDCGIIHRDIKPQNILLTEEGRFKVSDFGIASVKNTGTIASNKDAIGSVHYASPEQTRGRILDNRTDIYSFGIVLYELATGRVPFEGETAISIALKHSKGEVVKPCYINMSLNPSIQKIILKAISKAPAHRFENVDIMIEMFEELKLNPDEELGEDYTKLLEIPTGTINMGDMRELIEEIDLDMDLELDERDNFEVKIKEKDEKKIGLIPILLTVVAGVLVSVALIYLLFISNKPIIQTKPQEQITMESLVGMTVTDASKLLEENKVIIDVEAEEFNTEYEKGEIISQVPEKGAILKEGQTITVVISKGEETVKVPNFVGLHYEKANILANNSNLTLEIQREFSEEKPGNVISQSVEADADIKKGGIVEIVVSIGEKANAHIMPNIVDKPKSEAIETMTSINLKIGSIGTEYSNKIKEGNIISQSIPAGAEINEGSMVSFIISLGREDGKSFEEALEEENKDEKEDGKKDENPSDDNKPSGDNKPADQSNPSKNNSENEGDGNTSTGDNNENNTGDGNDNKPENQSKPSEEANNKPNDNSPVTKPFFVGFKQDGKEHKLRIVKVVNGSEEELFSKTYGKDEKNVKVNISAKGSVTIRFYVNDELFDEKQAEF